MRNLLKLSLAVVLAGVFGCGSDDTPSVIPIVTFQQDRNIVEAGDEITFTATAMDADTYSWDFGDGNTSTDTSPVHTYTDTGNYTITVTVTSTTGDMANSSSTAIVGKRFIRGFLVTAFNPIQADGKPWDEDGSGPELLFGFRKSSEENSLFYIIGEDNAVAADLPVGIPLLDTEKVELTSESWDFILLDNDEPLDQVSNDEIMVFLQRNPATIIPDEINHITGEGSFTISEFGFTFIILYEIRN